MVQEDPIDKALFTIQNLLVSLEKNLYTLVSVKELVAVDADIAELEKKVEAFAEESQALLLASGFSKADLRMFEDGIIPETASEEMKECLLKMRELKDFSLFLKTISSEERGILSENIKSSKQFKKLTKRQHMKKYRRLGGIDDQKLI